MARANLSDRDWTFDVDTDELWGRIVAVDEYRSWWPWLRRFDADDGLVAGATWRCEVAPPLPYSVRFLVHLDGVDEGRGARATVTGDVQGDATLSIARLDATHSRARLRSRLAPANPMLRSTARVARPVVTWGHDWVLDQGRRQFVDRAFGPGDDPS